ncbi:MAG TPA: RidA family protein [Mycobacteriales bacterium]|jgi:enamine deaminase RidA (YjgF/YER057c/UK114 family)|nr:RidA family protein [Mycobacteriales bacterium]
MTSTTTTQGLGEQAAARWAAVGAELSAAGRSWSDVARVTEFVAVERVAEQNELAEARTAAFGSASPAVVTVLVEHLWEDGAAVRIDVDTPATAPDGAVHLPLVLPVGPDGEVVAPGDFRGQYTFCLEQAGALLEGLGLSLSHLVQTIDFSTSATRDVYARCGRPRRELLGPVFPGAAGILVRALPHPDALVGFELVASRHRPEAVNPGWARYETLTYNPAVRAGEGLYGSGFAALDPVTQQAVHADDVAAQTSYTYGSVRAVLEAAGAGPEHLTRVLEYVTPSGVPELGALAAARDAALPGSTAAVSTVGCATLLRPEFALEVIPTAILPPAAPA